MVRQVRRADVLPRPLARQTALPRGVTVDTPLRINGRAARALFYRLQLNSGLGYIPTPMDRYVFAVADQPYCCWEYELAERNLRFLATLDTTYFQYIADRHFAEIEGDNRQRAAVALRAGYHHGLETLFSLLGALTQAPDAVPAWLPKCSTGALRHVVQSLSVGAPILTQCGRQRVRLEQLATIVHQYCWPDEDPPGLTGQRFARLWQLFTADFLNAHHIDEYNSIKHGFRVAAGGFTLRMGLESEYGAQAPVENMRTIGASPFGSAYLESRPVTADGAAKFHFRLRHCALNWRAEAMFQRLQLISCSINNVIGGLRCLNGVPPVEVPFHRPEDPGLFEGAWRWPVGINFSEMDASIDPATVDPIPRSHLLQELIDRTPVDGSA